MKTNVHLTQTGNQITKKQLVEILAKGKYHLFAHIKTQKKNIIVDIGE